MRAPAAAMQEGGEGRRLAQGGHATPDPPCGGPRSLMSPAFGSSLTSCPRPPARRISARGAGAGGCARFHEVAQSAISPASRPAENGLWFGPGRWAHRHGPSETPRGGPLPRSQGGAAGGGHERERAPAGRLARRARPGPRGASRAPSRAGPLEGGWRAKRGRAPARRLTPQARQRTLKPTPTEARPGQEVRLHRTWQTSLTPQDGSPRARPMRAHDPRRIAVFV